MEYTMDYESQLQSPPATPNITSVPHPDTSRPITVCFSDIVDSTASWSNSEAVMSEAHTLLYSILRALAVQHQLYEVKNLGDGFFLTSESTMQSLKFCLAVQRELAAANWSPEICQWREAMDIEQGKTVHPGKGLTLRMGLHMGTPFESQVDPVSGRMDYHGTMINLSARIMTTAGGDEIALSDAAIIALDAEHAERVGGSAVELNRVSALERCLTLLGEPGFEVVRKGKVKLKGVPGEPYVTLIRLVR